MQKPYYITTPIYYANAKIHFGNLYTSIIADVIARSKRLHGYDVMFATGTDENGQKMVQVAEKEGKDVMTFLDEVVAQDKEVMHTCDISYTDFIRTTESRHHKFVQSILQKTFDSGDIYEGEYEGLYCIGCEGFKKESDLIEFEGKKVCPDHLKEPEKIKEKNRFFRLSKYENKLKEFYKTNPNFIQPQYRYNEILSFIEGGLEDFSISRQNSNFGIPLPFDNESVTYIWYDALLNYLTVVVDNYDDEGNPIFKPHAEHMVHTLGKDIARFHAIYRPAMLMAAGLEHLISKQEFVGGFFTVNGQKMSKSLGNTLYAEDLVRDYNRDAMVFYLLYDIPQGADGDFSLERLGNVYESMLMGGWGNLVSRVTKLAQKNGITQGKKIHNTITTSLEYIDTLVNEAKLQSYMQHWYELVQQANLMMQNHAPWTKLKDKTTQESGIQDLEHLLWEIKQLTLLSAPFLTNSFKKVQEILGNDLLSQIDSSNNLSDPTLFETLYNMEEFEINLSPDVVYQKKDS
ncbi:Methionine--tRNA ligase [candidate division SR1 bacterium Aalborg_AAW-1]|nr:Methionine--tRNA ligase [candidate division SR1 bacterium Aalborg_AAW-1]